MEKKEDFFKAIGRNDTKEVQALLAQDPTLAASRNEAGVSAILFSLYSGKSEILNLLTERPLKLDIFEAAALGDLQSMDKLIDQNPNLIHSFSSDGFTPLHLTCFFGKVDAAKLLVQAGAEPNACSQNGAKLKPINSAAACRDLDAGYQLVEMLLSSGADISAIQHGGFTALHSAAANGNVALVKLLLKMGADKNVLSEDKKTPLQFAKERDRQEIVEILA